MENEKQVCWGVIGAGDVVDRKSGRPLQSLPNSRWVALHRRNQSAAAEVARKFQVPRIHATAAGLLNDSEVNAVYVATPPSTHAEYAIAALESGKDVYLEKPMALNLAQAQSIQDAVERTGRKLVMAHYRRGLPAFETVGSMLADKKIGTPRFARIRIIQPLPGTHPGNELVAAEDQPWRLKPEISGGGLFHDLAPHQLDLALHWFGNVTGITGISRQISKKEGRAVISRPDDYVAAHIEFGSGLILDGLWCFAADAPERSSDVFEIYGSRGRISFSFFGEKVRLETGNKSETFEFRLPDWLQEPMLKRTVDYFLGFGVNPCPAEAGVQTMRIIDALSGNS